MPTSIGYARVSSKDQNIKPQVAALESAGCNIIRQEKFSGSSREGRSELETIMQFVNAGDSVVVTKLDRLGRSTRDVLNLVHDLEQRGAHLRILEPAIDTAGPLGKVVLTVLGMVGEMELGFIRERQRVGIEAAKVRGVYRGRPVRLDHAQIRRMRDAGAGATDIAREVGCSRGMVYKALKMATDSKSMPTRGLTATLVKPRRPVVAQAVKAKRLQPKHQQPRPKRLISS